MFKVGDKVKIKDGAIWGETNPFRFGKVKKISEYGPWDEMYPIYIESIMTNGSQWFGENELELVEIFEEVKMEDAKYGIKYDRDEDPVEFFKTKKEAEKRIKQLLNDSEVQKDTMYLFEVGDKWKVEQPVTYDLIEV